METVFLRYSPANVLTAVYVLCTLPFVRVNLSRPPFPVGLLFSLNPTPVNRSTHFSVTTAFIARPALLQELLDGHQGGIP
ncbi:MAG TPA: hypothetical protein VI389_12550 [Geobacteraceae bacterium]